MKVAQTLRTGDIVAVRSRTYEASPEADRGANSAPAGSHAMVVTTWDNGLEMWPNPYAGDPKREGLYRPHTRVAIIQFTNQDTGEFWQANVNVNALNLIRRPRRKS